MKNIIQRNYSSTYDFVSVNNLEKEAKKFFGKDWVAEDDVEQIERLIEYLGIEHYVVVFLPNHNSEHDIKVYFSQDLKRIHDLESALINLTNNINLSKLNIRKDFELLNAHAHALKILR